jgi:hypothetical protein
MWWMSKLRSSHSRTAPDKARLRSHVRQSSMAVIAEADACDARTGAAHTGLLVLFPTDFGGVCALCHTPARSAKNHRIDKNSHTNQSLAACRDGWHSNC